MSNPFKAIVYFIIFLGLPIFANLESMDLHYFNDLKMMHMNVDNNGMELKRIGNNWSFFSSDGLGQSVQNEAFEIKENKKPVFYPNPFQPKDNPRLTFAITRITTDELISDQYEILIYNTKGYKVMTKRFDKSNYLYDIHARGGSTGHYYINLLFSESDFKGKLASGTYLFILFRNNEQISKGKFTIKAQ